MLRKYFLEIILILIELGLAVMGLFENVADRFQFWQHLFENSQKASAAVMVAMVGFLAAYVAIKMAIEGNKANEIKREIGDQNNLLVQTTVSMKKTVEEFFKNDLTLEVVLEQSFYEKFPIELMRAKTLAYLAHLDVKPPTDYYLPGSPAHIYYDKIFEIIKNNNSLKVQRVERVSKEKIAWIDAHIDKLGNARNFSLACYLEDQDVLTSKAVSVQCLDRDHAILVAVARHSNPTEPRDIWIRGESATKMWRQYYEERLLAPAIPIIRNGVVDQTAWNQIKAAMK